MDKFSVNHIVMKVEQIGWKSCVGIGYVCLDSCTYVPVNSRNDIAS